MHHSIHSKDELSESEDDRDDALFTRGRHPYRKTSTKMRTRWSPFLVGVSAVTLIFTAYVLFQSGEPPYAPEQFQHSSSCSNHPGDCRTTAPFIFDSVLSLLKQWPNTYASNGHSIVAASLPPNTQLYHARPDGTPPKVPTFFAFDAEMSLGIYGGTGTPRLYTMTTTRSLNLLYFDGQSASLTTLGTLDAQMAILQDEVPESPSYELIYNEDQRAVKLCALARDLRLDGFARMNAGFEVLLCNYAAAGVVQLYSNNITVPGNREREEDPELPHDPNRVPPLGFGNEFAPQNSWEWIRSGTWHYGTLGSDSGSTKETRLQLDMCGFLSFYDSTFRSLSGRHHGGIVDGDGYQNGWGLRRGHRLLGMSKEDIATMKAWLGRIAPVHASKRPHCSGIDWQALTETIANQHRTRAREILAAMVNGTENVEVIPSTVKKVHELTHATLYTYLEYPTVTDISLAKAKNSTISKCSSIYTEHIEFGNLNEFEIIIKESIRIVMTELCSWEWDLFEWSERHTTNLMSSEIGLAPSSPHHPDLVEEFKIHVEASKKKMEWIGWDDWHGCDRKCTPNELCYIPMWPVIYAPGKHQGGFYADDSFTDEEMYEFWRPKCLNRTMFDRGGGRAREPAHQIPDVPDEPLKSADHQ